MLLWIKLCLGAVVLGVVFGLLPWTYLRKRLSRRACVITAASVNAAYHWLLGSLVDSECSGWIWGALGYVFRLTIAGPMTFCWNLYDGFLSFWGLLWTQAFLSCAIAAGVCGVLLRGEPLAAAPKASQSNTPRFRPTSAQWLADTCWVLGVFLVGEAAYSIVRLIIHMGYMVATGKDLVFGPAIIIEYIPHIIVGAFLGALMGCVSRTRNPWICLVPALVLCALSNVQTFASLEEGMSWSRAFVVRRSFAWLLLLASSAGAAHLVLRRRNATWRRTTPPPTPPQSGRGAALGTLLVAVCLGTAASAGGQTQSVDQLIAAFPAADNQSYAQIISALADRGEDALPALTAAVSNENERIRAGALNALGEMRSAKAFDAIAQGLSDESWGVRMVAVRALRITPDPRRVGLLQKVAREDSMENIQGEAREALANLEDPEKTANLIRQLQSGETEDVRGSAAETFKKSGDPAAVGALVGALGNDPSWRVRGSAAQALGSIGHPEALQPLLHALASDANDAVQGSAALGLFWMARKAPDRMRDDAVLKVLVDAVSSGNVVTYHEALSTLEVLKDPRSVKPLLDAMEAEKDGEKRGSIEMALMNMKDIDSPELKAYLARREDVNWRDVQGGRTKLHLAVAEGNRESIEDLLARGADVNAKDETGTTPLFYASSAEIAELLLSKGADVNVRARGGATPLHAAVMTGSADFVGLLLAKGVDPNLKDGLGNTPLHYAASMNNPDLAELLLSKGANTRTKNLGGLTPLAVAEKMNQKDVADLLRKHKGK
jgi:HEAT repeat protein